MDIKTNLLTRGLIGDGLKRSAARFSNKSALIFYDAQGQQITYTYEQLNDEVNQVANSLHEMGIRKGDRIAIFSRNSPEVVVLAYALIKIGAWYTPLNFMFNAEEVRQLIESSKPRLFFVDRDYVDLVQSIAKDLKEVEAIYALRTTEIPEGWKEFGQLKNGNSREVEVVIEDKNVAALFYTSGTESAPKGVMINHRNCYYTHYSYMAAGAFQHEDTLLLSLPLIHIAGFILMVNSHLGGSSLVMTEVPNPPQLSMLMEKHKITLTALPPTLYLAVLAHVDNHDLSSLKKLVTWSSTIPKSMVDGWNKAAPNVKFFTIQGSSETTAAPLTGGWFNTWADIPNGDGRFVGQVSYSASEIKLIDEFGNEVPDGEPGEQLVRGPVVTSGYYNNEEANKKAFQEGWYHTGDVLIRDEDGNYYFADRKKDIVKTGGENVSSQEVENILSNHPQINQCAVFGVPDKQWGEAVVAAIVLKNGATLTEEEVIEYCRNKLSGFKLPKYVVFRSELPLTSAGKLLKRSLKEEYKELGLKTI